MKTIRRLSIVLVAVLGLSGAAVSQEQPNLTPDQIGALVKDLGAEDFAKRQAAEKSLRAAGEKAKAALEAAQNSTDAQVKASAGKLLMRLRFTTLTAVDYADVVPANSLLFLQVKNVAATIENSKKTAIGQLIMESPAFAPLREKISGEINKKPDEKQLFDLWTSRFKGQVAVSIIQLDLAMGVPDIRGAVIAEVTDPDPSAVYEDFIKQTHMFQGEVKTTVYNNVELRQDGLAANPGVVGLLGNHMFVAANLESAQKIIDGFLKPGGLGQSAAYQKLKQQLGPKPEMIMTLDFQAYMKAIMAVVPMPGFKETMDAAGVSLGLMGISSSTAGASFEDRYVVQMEGPPKGMMGAGLPPKDAPPPLNELALVPGNAVAASIGYIDGAQLSTGLTQYLAGLKKMMDGMPNAGAPGAPKMPDFEAFSKELETKTGVKLSEVAAGLKGPVGWHIELAAGGVLAPPDIGLLMTFATPEKAKAFVDALEKVLIAANKRRALQEVAAQTRKLYQLDLAQMGVPVPLPYAPTWTIDGNRLFVASSPQALRKQMASIDEKTPGLLMQPDFVKGLAALSPEERKGQLAWVDMKTLLAYGLNNGLPFLQQAATDGDVKKFLQNLPPAAQLFKDMPPLLMSSVMTDNQAVSILRSPLPPMPTVFLLAFGVGFMRAAPVHPPGPPADAAPGGF
ncbi:MAG TPA: hypothetical protein VGP72_20715 [Planctomycetota bacterium]|jgi:hypothetical protein